MRKYEVWTKTTEENERVEATVLHFMNNGEGIIDLVIEGRLFGNGKIFKFKCKKSVWKKIKKNLNLKITEVITEIEEA